MAEPPDAGATGPVGRRTDWLLLGVVGWGVFLLAIVGPSSGLLPAPSVYGTPWVAVLAAVVGGAVGSLGLSKWYDLRPGGPASRRPPPLPGRSEDVRTAPSFEIYRPSDRPPPSKGPSR